MAEGRDTAWTLYLDYQHLQGLGTAGRATAAEVQAAKEAYEAAGLAEVAWREAAASAPSDLPPVGAGWVEVAPGLWIKAAMVVAVRTAPANEGGSYVHTVDDGWQEGASWKSPHDARRLVRAFQEAERHPAPGSVGVARTLREMSERGELDPGSDRTPRQ